MRPSQQALMRLAANAFAATADGQLQWRAEEKQGFSAPVGSSSLRVRPDSSYARGETSQAYEVALLDGQGAIYEAARGHAMQAPKLIDEALDYLRTL